MGTFFELGKDKAAKGEGWAPPFISCAQDTVRLYPPLPLRLIGYRKPLPFLPYFCSYDATKSVSPLYLKQLFRGNILENFIFFCISFMHQHLQLVRIPMLDKTIHIIRRYGRTRVRQRSHTAQCFQKTMV